MNPDDVILISVDDHIAEPANMFENHVPAKYKDRAPHVVTEEDGREQWYYGDLKGRNLGLNAVAGKPREMFNVDVLRYDEMRPGCYDVDERVRDMNAGGQLAGLNFPNWTGFSGQVLNQGPDAEVNLVMIKAYNDWHVDEWCGAHPGRFIPCGILPLFDVEEAAAELRRLAGKGCHAVTYSENPEALGLPSIHTDYWDPLFAAAVDVGTVLCCHLGSSSRSAMLSADAPVSTRLTMSSTMSMWTVGELMWADFWNRFPDLKISITEGDVGWIPYFLWRAEHVHARQSGWTKHEFPNGGGPSDVFKRHMVCCFISDPIGVELLDHLNEDMVCWESDYPHSDTLNAMRLFQFDPFSSRSREQCTAAALRAESPDVDTVTHVGRAADERDLQFWDQLSGGRAAART
jgi:predicted TIM-barrel fold metal-dependent hydrolase